MTTLSKVRDSITNDREARMFLSHATEPGNTTVGHLIQHVGLNQTLDMLLDPLRATQGWCSERDLEAARITVTSRIHVKPMRELHADAERAGIRFVIPGDSEWPTRLNDLGPAAPFGLWVVGQRIDGAFDKSVAIVGARAATSYGEHVARELAEGMTREGYVIVSGAAYGIDGAAHRAALAVMGKTIAFLAGGPDRMYPAGHQHLGERMRMQGALISEVPPGSAPTKWRFLQRNRLIAASTQGSVVVEAGWRSGSLNEAGHARAVGRPVGAVPGPITSVASAGCHRLIDEGATIITSVDDIVGMIGKE
jgi:DNA processing protein